VTQKKNQYFVHTVYLCVFYNPYNKQPFFSNNVNFTNLANSNFGVYIDDSFI
jgi:hypothetical protein